MAEILKGAAVAAHISAGIIEKTEMCRLRGVEPGIAIVRVGDKPDDISYENRIRKNCGKVGISCRVHVLPEDISKEDFESELISVNEDNSVDGILLFRPLPGHLDEKSAGALISPHKDIDCMNNDNLCGVFLGRHSGFSPCTPEAVIEILKYYNIRLEGAAIAIVNRSMVLGKPLTMLLMAENATVTVCHSKTENLSEILSGSDIVITGIGKADFFGKQYFTKDSVVIDVGINFRDGKMTGDVNFNETEPIVKAITPVPGGVGAVTSMVLLKHAAESAWRRANG